MNRIDWMPKAVKQLGKLDRQVNTAIREGVNTLALFPDVAGVTRLTSHTYAYRLRVSNDRVLFDVDGAIKILTIQEVKKRDERTY